MPLLMADNGTVYIDQVKTVLAQMQEKKEQAEEKKQFYSSLKAKKPLQRMAKRSNCMLTLATARILRWYCKMMPRELAYSAVSFILGKRRLSDGKRTVYGIQDGC